MQLFEHAFFPEPTPSPNQPLASRMRPRTLEEFIGQSHLLDPHRILRRLLDTNEFTSIILFGPPGIGKTSLARIIAGSKSMHVDMLSAVQASVADVRRCLDNAKRRIKAGDNRKSLLFIDEIHRFNKAQQDVLLPGIEDGIICLIGATTLNPFFYLVGPLISRSQVFQLEPLSEADIKAIISRAISDPRAFPEQSVRITAAATELLARACEGDARVALTALETAVCSLNLANRPIIIDSEIVKETMQRKFINYDRDEHYDTISALIKSMRGSDPDAAVYWLAKMLEAGEEIRFVARRLVIFASEDIGNADPRALTVAVGAMDAVAMIGMPEARIILSQAVLYCATCPKSNAAIKAIDDAIEDIRNNRIQPVPIHLRDSHYRGAEKLRHGEGYRYSHDYPNGITGQEYLGIPKQYYQPQAVGHEVRIRERLAYWKECREQIRCSEYRNSKTDVEARNQRSPA